jgi:hypothetical protein
MPSVSSASIQAITSSQKTILFSWFSSEMVCTIYSLREIFLQKIFQMTVAGIPITTSSLLVLICFSFKCFPDLIELLLFGWWLARAFT